MALHRPAEFNKSHVPAFLADEEPKRLRLRLPVRALLRVVPPRGRASAARCSPSTARWPATTPTCAPTRSRASRSATTSGSWPSRPTSCYRIVDLMRHLRGSEARRHVREEIPFYTGARVTPRTGRPLPGRPARRSRRIQVRARDDGVDDPVPRQPGGRPGRPCSEGQADRVDAVAVAGRGAVAVGEDVAEVGAAVGAADLDPLHAEGVVLDVLDGVGDRLVEATASRSPSGTWCRTRTAWRRRPCRSRRPSVSVSVYSPVKARSVPALRSTAYSSGVSSSRHCSSVFSTS